MNNNNNMSEKMTRKCHIDYTYRKLYSTKVGSRGFKEKKTSNFLLHSYFLHFLFIVTQKSFWVPLRIFH